MTIVGTRPEIIKMSRTIYELDKNFNNILINTNQNFTYELGKIFFKDLKIRKADYNLKVDNKIQFYNSTDIQHHFENIFIDKDESKYFWTRKFY